MAKPNYGFEKRQRELEKKRKKAEKAMKKSNPQDAEQPQSEDAPAVAPAETGQDGAKA
ncbi:MAG: hypothetical protein K0R58_667 [Ramlibacter sp.]|jgi:hypothetical protein|nr:hypothetical protein [Ramlibacter sp.]